MLYYFRIAVAIIVVIAGAMLADAQSVADADPDIILPPREEKFSPSHDLLMPWREGTCVALAGNRRIGSGCYVVKASDYASRTFLTFSDEDGDPLPILSLDPKSPYYFGADPKVQPFATPGLRPLLPRTLILRIAEESAHWYKALINEKTGEYVFVAKSDSGWTRTSYEYWLKGLQTLRLNHDTLLLDAPNGKRLSGEGWESVEIVDFISLDKPGGEWAHVMWENQGKVNKAWLRWRDGPKILVGCYFRYS